MCSMRSSMDWASFESVLKASAWPHKILGQVLSSHLIVSETSGCAVHEEVDGLDMGGQHG